MAVFRVPDGLAGDRVDAAAARITGLSRSRISELIEAGAVSLAGLPVAKGSVRVEAGAMLEVDLAQPARSVQVTPQMVEALAKDGIKTLEDFATCADWELAGGWTTVDGQRVKDDGLLESFGVTLEAAQTFIMTARVMLGWVDIAELEGADHDDDAAEDTQEEAGV